MKVTSPARRVAAAILGAALGLSASSALAAGPACLRLPPGKIGFQLYTMLGDFRVPAPAGSTAPATADPARLETMYAALGRIGWRNVENYGGGWGCFHDSGAWQVTCTIGTFSLIDGQWEVRSSVTFNYVPGTICAGNSQVAATLPCGYLAAGGYDHQVWLNGSEYHPQEFHWMLSSTEQAFPIVC